MTLSRILLAAALVATSFAWSPRASAQCGYGYAGYGGFWDIGRLYGVLADEVPYFAAFPPVYYSYPVPRTYGYSPFAYPPGVMTPDVEPAQPLTIENPYFQGDSQGEEVTPSEPALETTPSSQNSGPEVDQTTRAAKPVTPLVIMNPYYTGKAQAAQVQPAAYSQR